MLPPRLHRPGQAPPRPHPSSRRGRGVLSNAVGRYERTGREYSDDGWDNLEVAPPPLRTNVQTDASRTIIARNNSPDLPFDRSINPYRGCEHGCSYCFARPTHAYLGFSPGLDFETRLFAKPEAAAMLERELAAPTYSCRPIAMGTNTDPYQPVERQYGITRAILKVLTRYHHPVSIVTKSALIMRDIDILAPMAAQGLARIGISITTLDRHLARKMEPRASTPSRRRRLAVKALSEAGIPTTAMFAPAIPGLNDHEMDAVLAAARAAGADTASYIVLRLPLEVKDLFQEWLADAVPARASRVMKLIRDMRGGKDYDSSWQTRLRGAGPVADAIRNRFRMARRRLGFAERPSELNCSRFIKPDTPQKESKTERQLSLF